MSMAQPQRKRTSPFFFGIYDSQGRSLTGWWGWHTHCCDQSLNIGWCCESPGKATLPKKGQLFTPTSNICYGNFFEQSTYHLCSEFLIPVSETLGEWIFEYMYPALRTIASCPGASSGIQFKSHPLWQKHARQHPTWPFQPWVLCLAQANTICHSVSGTSDTPFHAGS